MNISYVIPAFNAETMLEQAIDSIFNDNFIPGDEVIIVDDSSSDSTHLVAEKLAETHSPNITIIRNAQNKGCPASRNVGIAAAKNELIFNLDADNILIPDSISKLKAVLDSEKVEIVGFGETHYFIVSTKKITHKWLCKPGLFSLSDFFAGHINPGPGGNFLYTKKSWQDIGGYWEYGKGLHEAWGFTLKQLAFGHVFYTVPNTYYFHRYGHDSLFTKESKYKSTETELLLKMITPYKELVEISDWSYIQNNPSWFINLDKRPIKIRKFVVGKNGVLRRTVYGIFHALRKRIKSNAI